MKNLYALALIIAALGFGSCGSSDKPAYDNSLAPANATKPVTPLTIADTLMSDTASTVSTASTIANPKVAANVPVIERAPVTVNKTVSANTSSANAGLNPAHGQPGHRCEIAVGAPLNSAPTTNAQPQVQAVSASTPATITPANQGSRTPITSGGKLNPAHGQPGHDCAKPVGSPL